MPLSTDKMKSRPSSPSLTNQYYLLALLLSLLAATYIIVEANDNLHVAYEWSMIEFEVPDNETEQQMSFEEEQEQEEGDNAVPFGLEVYRNRLFLTFPRFRKGVSASLAYLDLNDNSTRSPVLKPYPSWKAHNLDTLAPELVSPYRIRADRCGRLWVLDTRRTNSVDTTSSDSTHLLVYDLNNDSLLRRYVFPHDHIKEDSLFMNLAVEDGDCDNTFAYAADAGSPGLVVYSWQADDSWRVMHHYFHPDPMSGNYTIADIEFQSDHGLYGMALNKSSADGYATLYFHPFSSTMEFSVSTEVLRNRSLATGEGNYELFKILGTRGPNAQAGASFLDTLTGVLFYALPNLNAIACWKTSNRVYNIKSQGRVYMNPVEMVFPSDIKVDDQNRLWVLSNRLQDYLYGELSNDTINFRILTAHVNDAIENTACDIKKKPLPEIINKLGNILNTVSGRDGEKGNNMKAGNNAASLMEVNLTITILAALSLTLLGNTLLHNSR